MAMVSLGQAARLAGLGKTTLARAIKAGRLSATRRDDGGYQIDGPSLSGFTRCGRQRRPLTGLARRLVSRRTRQPTTRPARHWRPRSQPCARCLP
jgi:hypothetical protein